MDKISELMLDDCYRMKVVHHGYLWLYEQTQSGIKHWDRRYFILDADLFRLYFCDNYESFLLFSSSMYFYDQTLYETHINQEMNGFLQLRMFDVKPCAYTNEDMKRFENTTQRRNENIFQIEFSEDDILYFAANDPMQYLTWIQNMEMLKENNQIWKDMNYHRFRRDTIQKIKCEMLPSPALISVRNLRSNSCPILHFLDWNENSTDNIITPLILNEISEPMNESVDNTWINIWKIVSAVNAQTMYAQCMDDCSSIEICPCFKRISFVMKFYDVWCNSHFENDDIYKALNKKHKYRKSSPALNREQRFHKNNAGIEDNLYDFLNQHFINYSTIMLLNDYFHIFDQHKCNEHEFQYIFDNLPIMQNVKNRNDIKCNVLNCGKFSRNERNQNISQYNDENDIQEINCIQILDRIHSTFYHSFDLFQLSITERISEEHKCTEEHSFADISKCLSFLKEKQSKLKQIRKRLNITRNKFITKLDSFLDNNHIIRSTFGYEYNYWNVRNATDIIPNETQNMRQLFIKSKYSNLKQELLSNSLCRISTHDWNVTCETAKNLLLTLKMTQYKAVGNDAQLNKYNIKYNQMLSINYIISALVFSNYAMMNNTLMSTFHIKHTPTMTNESTFMNNVISMMDTRDMIQRHSQLANFAKTLYELIVIYGKYMTDNEIYHGINSINKNIVNDKHLFQTCYHSYISASKKSTVVYQYMNDDGIIIGLKKCKINGPKIFDISWISNFEYEEELLVVCCSTNVHTFMSISSIFDFQSQKYYYYEILAIHVLSHFLSGKEIDDGFLSEYFTKKMYFFHLEKLIKCLNRLLQKKLEIVCKSKKHFFDEMFDNFCSMSRKTIKINFSNKMKKENIMNINQIILSYFINKYMNIYYIDIERVLNIFPNCVCIEIKCPILNDVLFENILHLIENNTQLQSIKYKWIQWSSQVFFTNFEEIIEKYSVVFDEYQWRIENVQRFGVEYLIIKQNMQYSLDFRDL